MSSESRHCVPLVCVPPRLAVTFARGQSHKMQIENTKLQVQKVKSTNTNTNSSASNLAVIFLLRFHFYGTHTHSEKLSFYLKAATCACNEQQSGWVIYRFVFAFSFFLQFVFL